MAGTYRGARASQQPHLRRHRGDLGCIPRAALGAPSRGRRGHAFRRRLHRGDARPREATCPAVDRAAHAAPALVCRRARPRRPSDRRRQAGRPRGRVASPLAPRGPSCRERPPPPWAAPTTTPLSTPRWIACPSQRARPAADLARGARAQRGRRARAPGPRCDLQRGSAPVLLLLAAGAWVPVSVVLTSPASCSGTRCPSRPSPSSPFSSWLRGRGAVPTGSSRRRGRPRRRDPVVRPPSGRATKGAASRWTGMRLGQRHAVVSIDDTQVIRQHGRLARAETGSWHSRLARRRSRPSAPSPAAQAARRPASSTCRPP